jgi:hypothetical protein
VTVRFAAARYAAFVKVFGCRPLTADAADTGHPTPSRADIEMTQAIVAVARLSAGLFAIPDQEGRQ